MTYCTEFYLKKKNHSSKLLLVNSYSFTSLMFPCSNLLGFSSFWLHCTGTRFWNQEKKKSMDMQSVSHSPEGHRLPCHFSKLTPEWKPLESRISPAPGLTLEQLWQPRAIRHQRCELDTHANLTEQPLKGEPKVSNCPLSAVPHVPRGSRIPGGTTAPGAMETVLHNHWGRCCGACQASYQHSCLSSWKVIIKQVSAVYTESQEHSWCKKTHTLTPAGPQRQQMTCPVHLPRH